MNIKTRKLLSILLTLVLLCSLAGPLAPSARAEGPYKVSLDDSFHGSVTADKDMADEGETVRLTVTPSPGYIIESISVYAIDLHSAVPTTYSEGNYVFTMPASEVQASATFRPAAPSTTEIPSVGLALTLPSTGGSYSGAVPAAVSISSGTGFTVKSANWFNTYGVAPASFEAGEQYWAGILLAPAEGYAFTDDTAVTIDTLGVKTKEVVDYEADNNGCLRIATENYTIPAAAATTYTITVNGGTAHANEIGEYGDMIGAVITEAAEGDKVWLVADYEAVPEGKWAYGWTSEDVSISKGYNSFTMPAKPVTVAANYEDRVDKTYDLSSGTTGSLSDGDSDSISYLLNENLVNADQDVSTWDPYTTQLKIDLDKDGSYDLTFRRDEGYTVLESNSVSDQISFTLTTPALWIKSVTFLFKAAAVPYTVDLSTGKMDLATGQEFADLFNSLGAWTHMSSTSGSSTYYYDLDKDGTEDISVTNSSSSRNVLLLTTSNITTDTYVISDSTGPYNPITFILKAPTVTNYPVTLIAYDKTNGTEQAGGEVAFSDSGKGTRISGDYEGNSSRTVGVYPASDYSFAGWAKGSPSGEIVSTSSPYTFTVTEDVTLYALFEKITTYPVWVGGVQVTSANKDDILGDGTFTYDHDSQTLTVNKRVENAVVIKAEEDLNVANGGIGSNSYLFAANVTFEMSGYDLAINSGIAAASSSGVCKITAKNVTVTTSTEYYMFNKADISATDTLTLTCENGTVGAGGSFRAKTINITANRGYSVFHEDAMITALGGDVTIINNGAGGYINSFKFTLTGANNVTIETNGGGSGYVFGSSSSNVVVESSGTLMLTNNSGTIGGGSFTGKDIIVTANRGYSVFHNDATITALGGDVTIKNNAENGYIASHDLTITGAKDVSIWADCNGGSILNGGATISASGAVEITNKGGWVTYDEALDITAGTTVLLLTQADNPVVGGTLTYNVGGKAALGYTDPTATTGGVEIPSGTVPDSSYRKITIGEPASVTEYPVWVGGVQVTDANKDDILGDGGKAKYDPESNTLTLDNPTVSTSYNGALIYTEGIDLNITGKATLKNENTAYGVLVKDGSLNSDANLTVEVRQYGVSATKSININGGSVNSKTTGHGSDGVGYALGGSDLKNSSGTVTATSAQGPAISTTNSVEISGGTVNVTGGFHGISTKSLAISGGTVTVEGDWNGIKAEENITISGGTVAAKSNKSSYKGIYAGGTIEIKNGTACVTADGNSGAIEGSKITLGDALMIQEPTGGKLSGDGKVIQNADDTVAKHAVIVPKEAATHTVTFEANGGTPVPAAQTVADGGKATKPADPTRSGFVFDGWYADATFSVAFDFDAPITADVTVYAKWKEETAPGDIVYTVVSGGNSTWTKGSSSGVTIVVKRNVDDDTCFSHFTSVQIGSTTLASGTDYTAVAGSTVITLNASALQKLTTGTKTVTINFDDGKAATDLTIKAGSSGTGGSTSPKTGDDSKPGLWLAVMMLSGLGIGGLVVNDKKRRYLSRH